MVKIICWAKGAQEQVFSIMYPNESVGIMVIHHDSIMSQRLQKVYQVHDPLVSNER